MGCKKPQDRKRKELRMRQRNSSSLQYLNLKPCAVASPLKHDVEKHIRHCRTQGIEPALRSSSIVLTATIFPRIHANTYIAHCNPPRAHGCARQRRVQAAKAKLHVPFERGSEPKDAGHAERFFSSNLQCWASNTQTLLENTCSILKTKLGVSLKFSQPKQLNRYYVRITVQ